jgi:uncharacterized protein (TIGR02246 family)
MTHAERRRKMNGGPIRRKHEAAIRQLVQDMQEGQNTKNGELFASAFAQKHDYVAIDGMFLPNQTREDNARVHQGLYDESRSSVAGTYGEVEEVEVRLNVAKIRPLATPRVVVAHVEGEFRLKGEAGKKAMNIITAVMQNQEGEWKIVAFHNAPVQKRKEAGTGFVIQVEDLETRQGGNEMIKDVPLIGIFVDDQEGALDFYTNELGLQKVQDEAYGLDARWITVSPAESKIRIVLKKAERAYEKAMVGNSDGAPVLTLGTDDVHFAYERLRERGVRFLGEPYCCPWGVGALLLDQDGNPILLQQELSEE